MFRWKAVDPNEDESINEGIRSLDLLCFSSQYYFVLSLATIGIGLLIMSLEALIRQTDRITSGSPYNPFQDKMLPFVIVIMFALCKVTNSSVSIIDLLIVFNAVATLAEYIPWS